MYINAGCPERWPELVGVPGIAAKAAIEKSNPYVTVMPLGEHDYRIMNMCCNRVFMFVSNFKLGGVMREDSLVLRTPIIG